MSDIERRTRLARLGIAPADFVYDELKRYADDVRSSPYTAQSNELEQSLASRNDQLIDLGLAAYGANREVVGELYRKGQSSASDDADAKYKQGLRLAVLANQTIDATGFLSRFPENVIGEAELAHVLKEADWNEVETLILNPTVADSVLLALYRNDKVAEGIDEKRRQALVALSARNGRLSRRDDDEHGPDMGHYDLHRAIFELLETVPTSEAWLSALQALLKRQTPDQVSTQQNIEAVLDRWMADENGVTEEPHEKDEYTLSGLSQRQEFRCRIAALYGKHYYRKETIIHGSMEHEDIARRCAVYANGKLTAEQIQEAHEKDGDAFVFAAMLNDEMLLKKTLRKVFEEECLTGRHSQAYEERCKQLHQKWRWFDPRPTADWMTSETEIAYSPTDRRLEEVQLNLNDLVRRFEKLAGLTPWLMVGLALLILWRT